MAVATTSGAGNIVIWEVFRASGGSFLPYEPELSNCLEFCHKNGVSEDIELSKIKPDIKHRHANVANCTEFNKKNGHQLQMTRKVYPDTMCAADVVFWSWRNDKNQFSKYNVEISDSIEKASKLHHSKIDLSPQGLPYIIDLINNVQINTRTGFRRDVKRQVLKPMERYVSDGSTPNVNNDYIVSLVNAASHSSHAAKKPKKSGSSVKSTVAVRCPSQPTKEVITNSEVIKLTFDQTCHKYCIVVDRPPKDDCCICMGCLTKRSHYDEDEDSCVVQLKCKHNFHGSCLKAMYDNGPQDGSIQCPQCKVICGVKYGNCPAGTMTWQLYTAMPLPGYTDCGTIWITYNISPGVQGPEHPHPRVPYNLQGFPRYGYLPDNKEGQKVLKLLIKAWKRRLTFTIGQSVTTGLDDCVVWNEIHHKTSPHNHASGHGYPDPNYLKNVTAELAAQGVVETDDEEA